MGHVCPLHKVKYFLELFSSSFTKHAFLQIYNYNKNLHVRTSHDLILQEELNTKQCRKHKSINKNAYS